MNKTKINDWIKYFPFSKPRKEQEEAINWICDQLNNGYRKIIVELGTGVGKSAIAVTVGLWLENKEKHITEFNHGATVLTSQKILQDQYVNDFEVAKDLRSASNFKCTGPLNGTCGQTSRIRKAVGPELSNEKLRCNKCPYRQAKDSFVASNVGITNYSYFLSEASYAGEIPPRRLLVLDECHNLEDEVRRWTAFEISEHEASKLGEDIFEAEGNEIEWLENKYKIALEKKLLSSSKKFKKLVESDSLSGESVSSLAAEADLQDKNLCQVNRLLGKGGKLLVSWHDNKKNNTKSIKFQPLEITELANDILYSKASAILMMSATLLSKSVFCKSVGLDENSTPFLNIPSPFADSAFGVVLKCAGRMNISNIEKSIKNYPAIINEILQKNINQKGIIHTINYKICNALEAELGNNTRLLFQKSAADREGILKYHLESTEPTVIVSPSMMEGLDLRDDFGRFQIICKVPYPELSDPIIKHKAKEWYNWRTIRTLVQAIGRSVRNENDWTKTYILDLCFLDLLEKAYDMFPSHLKNNISVEE